MKILGIINRLYYICGPMGEHEQTHVWRTQYLNGGALWEADKRCGSRLSGRLVAFPILQLRGYGIELYLSPTYVRVPLLSFSPHLAHLHPPKKKLWEANTYPQVQLELAKTDAIQKLNAYTTQYK